MNNNYNIMFVFSDQHRWCDMNVYGNKQVLTPNFDKFAKKAAVFEQCISNSPVCVPARGSILTGLFPLRHGAVTNDLPIRHDVTSIADVLNDNGYHTGYIGKWHLAGVPRDKYIPQGRGRLGFKEWKVCNCNHHYQKAYYFNEKNERIEIDGYEPTRQTELAIDFINTNKNKNWALFLSLGPPHDPYDEVPDEYFDIYRNVDLKLRENVHENIIDTIDKRLTKEDIIKNSRGYFAHITALDYQFGRLIKILEDTGQLDNTLIVYTSDHGDMLGSQGYTNKQLPYEESIKVPLMIYKKGLTIPIRSKEQIGLVDLPVSLLGLMGLSFPSKVDGRNLCRLFTDYDAKGLEECYIFDLIPCHQAAKRGGSDWRGVRTRKYTFARTPSDEGFILFDNENDPYQQNNLIHNVQYNNVKSHLLKRLNRFVDKHDKLVPWEEIIMQYELKEEWNKSQSYFGFPTL
jgi:arylsulfatase A-like enzyme